MTDLARVVMVGAPNVGKSLLFNRLTGLYVTVSNYPGTTVEISQGQLKIHQNTCELIDTPGMRSLLSLTEEEEVTKNVLLQEHPSAIVHVVDTKDLERSLLLTLQLLELGPPVILVLNMIDEAERLGLSVDCQYLQKVLGISVVLTDAVDKRGIAELCQRIAQILEKPTTSVCPFPYHSDIEELIQRSVRELRGSYNASERAIALLLLQKDPAVEALVNEREDMETLSRLRTLTVAEESREQSYSFQIALDRHEIAHELVAHAICHASEQPASLNERLSHLTINPITGLPFLFLTLYGLYQFVGIFGAQTAVAFLEDSVFNQYINPWILGVFRILLPWEILRDLFIGEFGIITLGLRYAIAIILPIVATFFLAFALIEDSGYLPRLAMLIDRLFKLIGLSGRAVIPIVLGFGCDTMATLVTRTLETRREKVIATFLLALAIPCSAQLGMVLALLAGHTAALCIWIGIIASNFLVIGYLTAKLLPGERSLFYMEVPPLRLPRLGNILSKTSARIHWYLKEVLPLFIGASVVIWLGQLMGIFQALVHSLEPAIKLIGLPAETAVAFLFGFFRRDYGAAGLYDLHQAGTLSEVQSVVAAVTLTLFVPCIAQFAITAKERGWEIAIAMAAFIFPYAFFIGWLVNLVLTGLGVGF